MLDVGQARRGLAAVAIRWRSPDWQARRAGAEVTKVRYSHRFSVRSGIEAVREFHLHPQNLRRISPPLVGVRGAQGRPLQVGDEVLVTIWAGPFPIRWKVAIEHVDEDQVVDRQTGGPFGKWMHRHQFRALSEHETEIRDEIEYQFRREPHWHLLGRAMALSLPLLFWYRRLRTKALLPSSSGSRPG